MAGTKQRIALISLLALLLILVVGTGVSVFPTASNEGYYPEQPIPFSHKLHAGDHKIDCLYCHAAAEKSRHATVPAMNVCMNCHSVVKTDSPHIQKLTEAYREGKPIEWVRIHQLPDFVMFPHYKHVQAGVSCQTCHGPVEKMERVYQKAPLTMGWCIQCHRGETTPRKVSARIYPAEKDPRGKPVAPTQCSTCHY